MITSAMWPSVDPCPRACRPLPYPHDIICFGDSTTATRGLVDIYADRLRRELSTYYPAITVRNAGVPGNTTQLARDRFQTDILDRSPNLVILQFGINDQAVYAYLGKTDSRVTIDDYEANLRYFIEELRHRGARVILMTPNPLRWTATLLYYYSDAKYPASPYDHTDPAGISSILAEYAQRVRLVATQTGAALVDVYQAFEDTGDVSALLLDGMHPNSDGHLIVFEGLLGVVI